MRAVRHRDHLVRTGLPQVVHYIIVEGHTFSRFSSVICEIELEKCIGLWNEDQYRGQVNRVTSTYA